MDRLTFILRYELNYVVQRTEFDGCCGVENVEFVGLAEDAMEAAAGGGEVEDVGDGGGREEDLEEDLGGKVFELHDVCFPCQISRSCVLSVKVFRLIYGVCQQMVCSEYTWRVT